MTLVFDPKRERVLTAADVEWFNALRPLPPADDPDTLPATPAVVAVLEDGRRYTTGALMEATGLPRGAVRRVLWALLRANRLIWELADLPRFRLPHVPHDAPVVTAPQEVVQ